MPGNERPPPFLHPGGLFAALKAAAPGLEVLAVEGATRSPKGELQGIAGHE